MRELVPVRRECVSYPLSHVPSRRKKKWIKRHIIAIDTRVVEVKFGCIEANSGYVIHLHVVSGLQYTRKFQRKIAVVLRAAEVTEEVTHGATRAS